MSTETLALRAPDYIKIAARLIAAHGWCSASLFNVADGAPTGLNLARAVVWAVAGRPCAPRDLTPAEAERVDEVLDHLEGPRGLGMEVSEYERAFASASAPNVAWEIELAGWRYETLLAPAA